MARTKRKNAHPRDLEIQGSRSWKKIDYIVGYNDLEKSWFAYSKAWFGLLWGRSEKEIVTKARKRIDKHLAPSYPYPRKRKNPAPGNYFESCKKKLSQAIDRQVIKILKSKEFKGIEDARKDDHFGIAFRHRGDTYYLAITAFQKLNLRDHAVARVILYRDDYLRQLTKIWEKEEVEVEGDNKGAHMGWSIISAIPTRITTKWRTQGRANPRKRKYLVSSSYPEVEKAIRSANRYARQYNKLMKDSLSRYGRHGSLISGVGRDHFPASVKSKLVELLVKFHAKQDEAAAEFKEYHPRTNFYRSKRSAPLREMMVKAGHYGTGRILRRPKRWW